MANPVLAVTPGEPAGIGPDIVLVAARSDWAAQLVAVADPALLEQRAEMLGLDIELLEFDPALPPTSHRPGRLFVDPIPLATPCKPGKLDPSNANYVLQTLQRAVEGCQSGTYSALVTAPVQKSVINDAGVPFSGHTEFLAAATGTDRVVMMLATEGLRVALATTHLPLQEVPRAISGSLLEQVLGILHRDLVLKFGLANPRIGVLGLNPHAGEGGHMGREEIDIIIPALESLRGAGMNLLGPLPADTAFNPNILDHCDALLAMYHDQGLPVLKFAGFGKAVNITLGLPIIRTSVDHGTALDLAGTGRADVGSLKAAIETAISMADKSHVSQTS